MALVGCGDEKDDEDELLATCLSVAGREDEVEDEDGLFAKTCLSADVS